VNYLAHGHRFLDRPYFLAGTALPDWLNVVNRRVRVRARRVSPFRESADHAEAELAAGILRHHHDDAWFHRTRAFVELSAHFSTRLRDLLAPATDMRPSFVGHVLVELLLDWVLTESQPESLPGYYTALGQVDPDRVAAVVGGMTGSDVGPLAAFIRRFLEVRFLYDYREDGKLLVRLNQVMVRVGLPRLPEETQVLFVEARGGVQKRAAELLTPPSP
jgi:hypothetical protein